MFPNFSKTCPDLWISRARRPLESPLFYLSYTVQFPDGKQMDIKCCGCQDEPSWTEAVLFDADGSQLCCTEPGDSFDGPWELQYEGIRYTATIKTEHT